MFCFLAPIRRMEMFVPFLFSRTLAGEEVQHG